MSDAEIKEAFAAEMAKLREQVAGLAVRLVMLKGNYQESCGSDPMTPDRGEVIANMTLAQRHVEDAQSRLRRVAIWMEPSV